jgi:hypothetical protein
VRRIIQQGWIKTKMDTQTKILLYKPKGLCV